jgi:PAS domain S-box-containing protein
MTDHLEELERLKARVVELEQFERLANAFPLGVAIFAVQSAFPGDVRLVYGNARTSVESKRDISPLIGRSIRELSPDDYMQGTSPHYEVVLRRVLETGSEEVVELDRGVRGCMECAYVRLNGRNVAAIYRNVTAHKQAQQALLESEARLRATETELRLRQSEAPFALLVESVKDYAIFMLDPDGRVASWNRGAERLKGYSSREIIGQHFSRFYSPADIQDGKPERELVVARTEGRFEEEAWRVRKDGSRFLANVLITAVLDKDGKLVGFAKVTRDVTERHHAEAALKLVNRELEAFGYSVAHDLRAPLRAMNGFAQMLLSTYQEKFDEQGQDWLQEILLNALKMGELIDALLSMARVARSELTLEPVDLSAAARAAAGRLALADPARTVELAIADNLVAEVDAHLARTLLDNLLTNAWKFTGHVPLARVEVGVTEAEGRAAFFVRDNGAGFDMAFADKLFTPFQRLHSQAEFPGTGIGLATVQRIVHRHNGRIWAEGHVDGGATFYFTLPGKPSWLPLNQLPPTSGCAP